MKALAFSRSVVAVLALATIVTVQQPQSASASSTTHAAGPRGTGSTEPNHKSPVGHGKIREIPGHYVVTVRDGHSPKGIAKQIGARPQFVYTSALNGFAAELTDKQVTALRRHPYIVSVEPDGIVEGDGIEYTDVNSQPWGLDRIDQRSRTRSGTYSWTGTGSGVTVYVIDSGIQTAHSDFGGRAQVRFDAFGGNGQDCFGHGTHVAGTIGGSRYGVAKSVQLRSVKVLDCTNHGSYAGIIAGVDWVRMNAVKPAVANMSLGGPFYAPLNTAVTNLVNSGVFVAVSAGNDNVDACTASPASAVGTMTVAAVDWNDNKASFSNWGQCVDIQAPGVTIQSARLGGGSTEMNGTSMASPHVAGVAALLKGDYGDMASSTVISNILSWTTNGGIGGNYTGTPNRLIFQPGW